MESFLRWDFLIRELIFIYCGLFVLILVVFLCVVSSFTTLSAKFPLWPSSDDLLRVRIGMLSLVTVSPVITAFHSCCLSHQVFDQVKSLAGLGRIWNRSLLTMLTWNRRDSTPLSAAPRGTIQSIVVAVGVGNGIGDSSSKPGHGCLCFIVIGNGHGDTSSNPGRDWLHFT